MPSVTQSRAKHPPRRIRRTAALVGVLLGLVVLTACSGARDTGATSGAVAPDLGQVDRDVAAGEDAVAGGGGSAPDEAPPGGDLPENAPPAGTTLTEQIVRTGDVSVRVDDITSAANRITALLDSAGGDIGSDQRYGDAADGSADLVLRIPPDKFFDLLEAISDLGEELSRSVSADDVSTVVADVNARVESLQNSVDRLLALAAQAVTVSDLITVESELSYRQAELESLQAQQRALADQVTMATLSVRLTASSEPDTEDTGFLASLSQGWEALRDFGAGLVSIAGLVLPWIALLAVILVPLWLVFRRRRSPAAPAAAESPATGTAVMPAPDPDGSAGETVTPPAASEPARPPA